MTTNSQLRGANADLRTEVEQLKAQLAVRDQDSDVYERRFLLHGHADGPAAYVAMHRHGNSWAVIDSNAGRRTPSWWDGRIWRDLDGRAPRNSVYRFTAERAEELARGFAKDAAALHHRNMLLEQLRRIEEHAAEGLDRFADVVTEATADLTPEVVEGKLAALKAQAAAVGRVSA